LFEKVFNILRDTLHCDRIVLLLYHPGSESLEVTKTTGLDAGTAKGLSFNLGEGISGMAAASMQPIYCTDLSIDDRNLNYKGRWVSSGSLLSMPMVLHNRLIGVLNIHHQRNNAFSPVAQQMAQAIADQTAISIENSRLYEKTRTLSATDDLTGLANRRQFQDYLQREWAQSRRYHSNFSLLMLDIDHFKAFNDTNGHLKGDIVLKKVAALLLQNTRGIDLVARFGGEEFIILLPKSDKEGSLAVAKKLCSCIESEYFNGMELSQPEKKLTVSIGTSTFPTDSTDVYDLLNRADEALYQVKRNGRNHARVWSRDMIVENSTGSAQIFPSATN
jgi:diguanylate cyclase (GGDEF)-like protein